MRNGVIVYLFAFWNDANRPKAQGEEGNHVPYIIPGKDGPLIADWLEMGFFCGHLFLLTQRHVVVVSLSQSEGLIDYVARTPGNEISQQEQQQPPPPPYETMMAFALRCRTLFFFFFSFLHDRNAYTHSHTHTHTHTLMLYSVLFSAPPTILCEYPFCVYWGHSATQHSAAYSISGLLLLPPTTVPRDLRQYRGHI